MDFALIRITLIDDGYRPFKSRVIAIGIAVGRVDEVMSEEPTDFVQRHSALGESGRKSMSQIMKSDVRDIGCRTQSLEPFGDRPFDPKHAAVSRFSCR